MYERRWEVSLCLCLFDCLSVCLSVWQSPSLSLSLVFLTRSSLFAGEKLERNETYKPKVNGCGAYGIDVSLKEEPENIL